MMTVCWSRPVTVAPLSLSSSLRHSLARPRRYAAGSSVAQVCETFADTLWIRSGQVYFTICWTAAVTVIGWLSKV